MFHQLCGMYIKGNLAHLFSSKTDQFPKRILFPCLIEINSMPMKS